MGGLAGHSGPGEVPSEVPVTLLRAMVPLEQRPGAELARRRRSEP